MCNYIRNRMLIPNPNLQIFQCKQQQYNISEINYIESNCNKNKLIIVLDTNKKIEMTYNNKTECSKAYDDITKIMLNNITQDNAMR
jgi:hypothetical protein